MGNPVTRSSNDRNVIVAVAYDKVGRMTHRRDPRGHATTYTYDALDRRTSLTNPLNDTWQTSYGETSAGGTQTTLSYPGVNDGSSYDVVREFDPLGRLASINYGDPTGTPDVKFAYDLGGKRTNMTEYGGAAFTNPVRQTSFDYDDANRMTQVGFDADGSGGADQTVDYAYDTGGNRTSLTLDDGTTSQTLSYEYDAKGQLVALTDFDGNRSRFAYDRVGRQVASFRPNGLRSAYRYDRGGRLRRLQHVAGQDTVAEFRYEVDKRGNRTEATELLVGPNTTADVTILSNDPAIRTQGDWTQNGAYLESDTRGDRLKLLLYGKGSLKLTVQCEGQFDLYVGGSFWQSYLASTGDREIEVSLTRGGLLEMELRNRRDARLAFKQVVVADVAYDLRTIGYSYDALSRLTDADYFPGGNTSAVATQSYAYGYDLAGNLVSKDGVSRIYNDANQMTDDGNNTLTYDANGNLTSAGVDTYTWDRANRMVVAPDNTAYQYDGLGNRVQQTVSSTVTDYLLDLQPGLTQVLGTTDGTRYVHSPRGIYAEYHGTTWQHPLQDGLGSVRSRLSAGNAVTGVQSYDPYGEPDATYPTGYGFTGEQTDANGQVYLRARYYDPGMGIFPSLDPFEGMMDRPMSINGYSWVRGNVINSVDPTGMQDVYPMAPTPDGGGVGSGLPFHPAYIAHLLEGLAIIGGGTVAAASSTLLAHELYNWVKDNYFDRGISITSNSIRIGGHNYNPADLVIAMEHLGNGASEQALIDFIADAISPSDPVVFVADQYSPALPLSPVFQSESQQTLPRDYWEIGVELGKELCRFALWELLQRLVPGIRDIPLNRTAPDDDDDCLDGRHTVSAARYFANKSIEYTNYVAENDENKKAVISIAYTRAKNMTGVCQDMISTSNSKGKRLINNSGELKPRGERAIKQMQHVYQKAINNGVLPVGFTSGLINFSAGEQGHAETNLINGISYWGQGQSIKALGINQIPCDSGCSQLLISRGIKFAYGESSGDQYPYSWTIIDG